MINKYLDPNSPYLSEEYCSDEEYYEYLEKLNSGEIAIPKTQMSIYDYSDEYCSDEDYYGRQAKDNKDC